MDDLVYLQNLDLSFYLDRSLKDDLSNLLLYKISFHLIIQIQDMVAKYLSY
jgi:hypothetical protein